MSLQLPGDLNGFIAALETISRDARQTFGDLTHDQINWKPTAQQWSIGQCFDHLITTNRTYFPTYEAILRGDKKSTIWEKLPVLPGFWGSWLIKTLLPDSGKKLKAPPAFAPTQSTVEAGIIRRFQDEQAQLINFLKQMAHIDLKKTIITSPAAAIVTYSLFDTCTITVVHEHRHFQQAKRVMDVAGFPLKNQG
ncbi:MAG TPA: DinB family protein [Acidobacteriota bacterium]|nr:DinB family protein [Acidobacteriota bacterium]